MGVNLQRNSEHKQDLAVAKLDWSTIPEIRERFGFDCSKAKKTKTRTELILERSIQARGVPYHNGWINPKSKWIGAPRSSSGAQNRPARAQPSPGRSRAQSRQAEGGSGDACGGAVRGTGSGQDARGQREAQADGVGTSPGDAGSSGRQWMMGIFF